MDTVRVHADGPQNRKYPFSRPCDLIDFEDFKDFGIEARFQDFISEKISGQAKFQDIKIRL